MSDDPLTNEKFKNIGVDPNFIKDNATTRNDTMNQMYHGGSREIRKEEVTTVVSTPDRESAPAQEQSSPKQSQLGESTMDTQQLEQMMDKKVYDLALKMQEYADQTDKTIANLQAQIEELKASKAQTPAQPQVATVPTQQATPAPQPASQEPAQAAPQAQTTLEPQAPVETPKTKDGYSEEDVSIEKIFDFSNKPNGQR